jgi:inosine/xanthosine triphosphate pyrophosphatase family protein
MKQLLVVTGNIDKYNEIKNELFDYINPIQSDIDLTEPQSLDMTEISKQKAYEAFQIH